jgi:TatD DNase family protein
VLFACVVDRESSGWSLTLERANAGLVSAFVGLHPSEAFETRDVGWLETLLRGASGLGEVGMDPKYSSVARNSPQRRLFLRQLSVAESFQKPVQVHSRDAEHDCLEALASHRLPAVLLHWFSEESLLRMAEQKGYFVSFGPALLVSKKLQRMASSYSPDLILAESDGPISFAALGGAEGPMTIPSVLLKLSELRRTGFSEMAEMTTRNAVRFLPSSGKVKPTTGPGQVTKIGQD